MPDNPRTTANRSEATIAKLRAKFVASRASGPSRAEIELRRVAYHEAGHALAVVSWLRGSILCANIHEWWGNPDFAAGFVRPSRSYGPIGDATVDLAGPVAEHRYTGIPILQLLVEGSRTDARNAQAALERGGAWNDKENFGPLYPADRGRLADNYTARQCAFREAPAQLFRDAETGLPPGRGQAAVDGRARFTS
jgi:hypothetical protein